MPCSLRRRLADADAQSREVLGAERLGDRAQSVVAGESAAELQLQATGLEVEFVVGDDQAREVLERRARSSGGSAAPDSFMNVVGTARVTGPRAVVTVALSARWRLSSVRRAPRRSATSRTASPPTL